MVLEGIIRCVQHENKKKKKTEKLWTIKAIIPHWKIKTIQKMTDVNRCF